MKIFKGFNLESAKILKSGGVGVIPTDTIYGIAGSALNKKTVERIYGLRRRDPKKPMIILIGSINDLKLFGIRLHPRTKIILSKIWPNKVSVILPCPAKASREGGLCKNKKFAYLHRGTNALAFRFPKGKKLTDLLKKTGPLAAPSANWEGYECSKTVKEAQKYFGGKIDLYVDSGTKRSLPSTLIEIKNGAVRVLREGAVRL